MAPPATTPANEPASQPALARTPQLPPMSPSEIFGSAVTGNLASTTKSNAPLDPQSIASLAAGIVSQKPTVQTINASARSTHFQVLYAVDGAASGRVLVNIGHYTEAAAAQEVMRQYLSTFDADVSTVTRKPDKPLGQVSLLTGASVFWVRDAIWVRLQVVPPLGPQVSQTPKTEPQPATSKTTKNPTASSTGIAISTGSGTQGSSASTTIPQATPSTNPILDKLLLPLAGALDAHLLKGAVPSSAQLKPNTKLQTPSSYEGPRGAAFSFRLADAKGTHAIKPAEPTPGSYGTRPVAVVTPTGNGTADGVYNFVGRQVGKAKVLLLVARADNLAVGAAEVSVSITSA